MIAHNLGRLERVDLRAVWTTEDQDFTPWLAQEVNLAVLSETLNMELVTEGTEQGVGPFRADILCRDTQDDSLVLIENQIERTNHTHLGQLLTYATGLQTSTVIWVASEFRDEHRAALDWLNVITGEGFRFFGIEVELWKIGNSQVAPKFNIVSRPNNWSKTTQRAARGEVGETALQHQRFWEHFSRHLAHENRTVRLVNPPTRAWTSFGIGRTYFQLWAQLSPREKQVSVELRLTGPESKAHFALLADMKENIEHEIGDKLEWAEQPTTNVSRIILAVNADPTDENDWPKQAHWIAEALERFTKAFRQRVRNLNAADWQPDAEFLDE